MSKIIAIVVTYNRKQLLLENINALLKQNYKNFDILIVDNASTDGTKEEISEFINDGKIKYINTGKNLGGAGGFSFGINEALVNNYDFAWLMDDDTIPAENALKSLINKSKLIDNKFSFLGSLVKWTDGTLCIMNIQRLLKKWAPYYDKLQYKLVPISSSSFVSMFINLKVAKKVGLPFSKFFIYGDDWEYSERLRTIEPGYLDCDSIVIHKMSSNQGTDVVNIDLNRVSRYYYNYRNLFYIYKHYYGFVGVIKYILIFILTFFKIIFKAKDNRLKRIWYTTKGFFVGIFFNPKVEYANSKERA
jgi:GT2 family glycosyltransferase